jgi:hypothetical protein
MSKQQDTGVSAIADRATAADAVEPVPVSSIAGIPDAGEIIAALKAQSDQHIWATELAFTGGSRRCDFWKLEVHASKGFRATAYEVKVSRSDFRRDNAIKQREARLYSDRFYYVAPAGLLKSDEIPEWAGLIEWDGARLRTVLAAPHRDKDAPSWELFVSLIRNSGEIRRETDIVRAQLESCRAHVERQFRENSALRAQVRAAQAGTHPTGRGTDDNR